MDIDGGARFDLLVWLASPRPGEEGWTGRIFDDVESACVQVGLQIERYQAPSKAMLLDALDRIAGLARQGRKPFLHLDMHGSEQEGIEIAASNEHVPWSLVVHKLRAINEATGNNLCVVAATCEAFHAIKLVGMTQAVPFFLLVAPSIKVKSGFLQDHIAPFYRQMLETRDIIGSIKANLEPDMRVFHCGAALARAMAQYISVHCKGKTGEERRERLLSEVLLAGRPRTPSTLGEIRKSIKAGVKPDQAMLDRFADKFLVGKPCGFSFEQLNTFVEALIEANVTRRRISERLARR
ncbi:hypothetical protein JQ616_17755 [Bradyrhizobium tropiciagri]|uniref:hypothetical protein n=1 Tax=Bradyrhizobium tropiciagri TaxID=312253 RepID=UPI001BAD4DD1|nr:hypothetical protein [Bradyrhizobium tropiciagri]MBR0896809.1 hypothetical protein [Bradyrhizobium tropiciagri]